MNRRDFLKGTFGLVVACCVGSLGGDGLSRAEGSGTSADVGPHLIDGLSMSKTGGGADLLYGDACVFKVNESGRTLLSYADGRHTIAEIAQKSGTAQTADQVAMFFVTLGEAGYLQSKIEVNIVENYG